MADEPVARGTAERWLARAKGNLARARQPKVAEAFWEDHCYDLQQAVEKSLKALLIARGVRPPRTHDLAEVLRALRAAGVPPAPNETAIAELTRYAVAARYPSEFDPASEADFRAALAVANEVVAWCERLLETGPR